MSRHESVSCVQRHSRGIKEVFMVVNHWWTFWLFPIKSDASTVAQIWCLLSTDRRHASRNSRPTLAGSNHLFLILQSLWEKMTLISNEGWFWLYSILDIIFFSFFLRQSGSTAAQHYSFLLKLMLPHGWKVERWQRAEPTPGCLDVGVACY